MDPTLLLKAHERLQRCMADDRDGENPDDPSTVQSMPIILNIPKVNPPVKTELLEAAAKATVACCLDDRAGGDTAYAEALQSWYGARIRKIARRARNTAWDNVHDVPGVTVESGTAEARACVPTAVVDTHPLVSRLQIGGTDLPDDAPGPLRLDVPTVFAQRDLGMTLGKAAAQVGHGAMLLAAAMPPEWVLQWAERGFDLQVREISAEEFDKQCARADAVPVRDAGYTEVDPGSLTVVAVPTP